MGNAGMSSGRIKRCLTDVDFQRALESSHTVPTFLFKHSTICPVSAAAWSRFVKFAEGEDRAEFWQVLVRENRDLSQFIASQTGVEHQSPQVILFRAGRAIRQWSHRAITEVALAVSIDSINYQ